MVDQGGGSKATERTLSVLPLEKRAALATVLVAIAFACQQTVSGGLYAFNRYALSFGCGESPAMFPSGTVRTLEEYSLDGPIFNSIAAGGYLELHRPREKTFVDGRLEVMDESLYLPYLRAPYGDAWDALEARWQPTLALVPATACKLVRHLLETPGWALIDVDAVGFLFARATPDHLEAIAANQERLRRLDTRGGRTDEAIVPPPPPSWLAALFGPKSVRFESLGRGANFIQAGMFEAPRRELRQALLASSQPNPGLIKAYVIALAELDRLDEARAWGKALVERAPEDKDAAAILARLNSSG